MHKEEHAVNIYVRENLRHDVEKTVDKLISVRQKWIVIGITLIFIIYASLAVWIGLTVNTVKKDSLDANNTKRELAIKTDSVERDGIIKINSLQFLKIQEERAKIAEERTKIAQERKTDSLKRVKLFEINDNYRNSIEEWKNRRK